MRRRHCFHLIVASICQSTSIGVPSIVQHAIYRCNRSIIELRRAITFTTWAFYDLFRPLKLPDHEEEKCSKSLVYQ